MPDIVEPGSQLLTMEFLISLAIEETGAETKVYFRLFNEQFMMKLKDFSIALGFHKRCILDPNDLAKKHRYDRNSCWSAISNEHVSSKNSIVSIHNPTLRLRDRNWRPEGGEWEPIKISLEIDPLAYIPKITTSPRT